jgi:hypothetical protein
MTGPDLQVKKHFQLGLRKLTQEHGYKSPESFDR